ncbi:hypothetical protein ACIHCQ_42245 [Streptomyces sp. NPDC052236]|uniref:hypothetical protein n=1 Tax=Streptomyces sp. NPDC052236 TaxID=3365686 RepID=UPI0037D865CD
MTTRLQHTPAAVAAIMRSIGQRRRLPLPAAGRAFICSPCSVSWVGEEADCWNCGLPASSEYARHSAAVRTLLASVSHGPARPATRRRGRNRKAGELDAVIGSALRQVESAVVVDGADLARRREALVGWMAGRIEADPESPADGAETEEGVR